MKIADWPHPQKPGSFFEPRKLGEVGEPIPKPLRTFKEPKPLRKANRERRIKMYQRNYGDHSDFLRTRPCVVPAYGDPEKVTRCFGRREIAHRECRQAGGCGADWRRTFTACERHHKEQEGHTAAFEAAYGLDLNEVVEIEILADLGLSEEEYDAAEARLARLREPR